MADFFHKVATDIDSLEQEFLGPDYKYYENINNPMQLGMSTEGSMGTMIDDTAGLINYVEVLVAGTGAASKTGKPLGDKFFLKTGGQCTEPGGQTTTRSLYINNVPDGQIPGLSALAGGMSFPMFEGLLPGVIEDIGHLNPLPLFGAFMQGANPTCTQITMPTIDVNNAHGVDSGYVADSEIQSMNPEWFTAGHAKPAAPTPTKEGFLNANNIYLNQNRQKLKTKYIKKGQIPNLYRIGFGVFLVYLLYKLMQKKH